MPKEKLDHHRLLIFTDAATSAKMHISTGAFLWLAAAELDRYAALTTQQLTTEIHQQIVYKKYDSKKSTASEIQTVIEALNFVKDELLHAKHIVIYTDCQSLCDLLGRRKLRLQKNNFITRAGKTHPNAALYRTLYALVEAFQIETVKIKGHAPDVERVTTQQRIFAIVDHLSRVRLRLCTS